jgi:hypothetical protein
LVRCRDEARLRYCPVRCLLSYANRFAEACRFIVRCSHTANVQPLYASMNREKRCKGRKVATLAINCLLGNNSLLPVLFVGYIGTKSITLFHHARRVEYKLEVPRYV